MTSVLPPLPRGPWNNVVTFATKGGLGITMPPNTPPTKKKFGNYCFRATCYIENELGCPVAKLKGYDTSPEIGKDTEDVCRMHVRTMSGGTFRCGEAQVVMLPHAHMECSGQMVFVMDGEVRRLL